LGCVDTQAALAAEFHDSGQCECRLGLFEPANIAGAEDILDLHRHLDCGL
jgi:hypothetical protein